LWFGCLSGFDATMSKNFLQKNPQG